MLITICIPVYNMKNTIKMTIESALKQTYSNLEIIVLDNQSQDGTFEIANSIKDSRLKVIRNERNLGAYGNHNRCMELSRGEWLKFLHGDDDLLPECISKFVEYIKLMPDDIGLIGCGAIKYDQFNNEILRTYIPDNLIVMKAAPIPDFILAGNFFGTPSMVMIRNRALQEVNGFDISMEPASDGDCWINLRRHYISAYIPEHLVIIRDDPHEDMKKEVHQRIRFCDQILRQIDKWHNLDNELSNSDIENNPYSKWILYEMFGYWHSGIIYIFKGNIDLILFLVKHLTKRNIFYKSAFFYLRNIFSIISTNGFRSYRWDNLLKDLIIN